MLRILAMEGRYAKNDGGQTYPEQTPRIDRSFHIRARGLCWPGTRHASVATMELLIVMVALLVATLVVMPGWPYSARWSYVPASACGFLALLMAALVLVGRL
jgi:hypothetical protein